MFNLSYTILYEICRSKTRVSMSSDSEEDEIMYTVCEIKPGWFEEDCGSKSLNGKTCYSESDEYHDKDISVCVTYMYLNVNNMHVPWKFEINKKGLNVLRDNICLDTAIDECKGH